MLHALKPFHCPNCNVLFTSRDTGRQFSQKFPVILPCNHSVCDSCLYAAVKAKKSYACTLCKSPVDLSAGSESVAKLHPDVHVLGILNASKKCPLPSLKIKMVSSPEMRQNVSLKGGLITTTKVCDNCSQVEALWQCDECQSNYCNLCFDQIHKTKSRKKHEVKKIFAELYNTLVQSGCQEHKNKSVEFYCERDDKLTCSHCMLIGDHIGHEVKTLVDKNKSCASDLKNLLADVSEIEKRLKYTEHLLSEVSAEEKIDVSAHIKAVHDHFHSLHSILQVREAQLISKLEEIANNQNEPFEKMVFEISGYQKDIASVKKDAESVIENPCLAISAPYLKKRLETFKEIPCFLLPLYPNGNKNVNIDLQLTEEITEDLKKHGSLEYTIKPRFHLVPTHELPENYCMEIPESFAQSVDDDTQSNTTADNFSEDSLMDTASLRTGIGAAYKYRDINKMNPETVFVSHIKDPSCFWIQRCNDMKKLLSVSDSINRFCRSREANHNKHISLEKGDLYLVQFTADKNWYRGRIKRILEPGSVYEDSGSGEKSDEKEKKVVSNNELKVEIYYIDYGNTEIVSISKLRNIQPRFLHLPALAKQCSLIDIAPANGEEWSLGAIRSFTKFVNRKEVIMQIFEERNNVLYVDLSQVPDSSITYDVPVSVRDALVFLELALFPSGRSLPSRRLKPDQQKFLPPERLRANADIAVIVSHVDSPSHFYVQQLSTASYLSSLIFEMSEAYSRDDNSLLHSIYAPSVGMICAAQFSVDQQWYRAQVKRLPGGANVEVQYVDFGNREIINHKFIRKLSDKFRKLNIQAIPCKLADVTYNQEKGWSTEAKEWLTTKVSKKQLTLKSTGFDSAESKAEVILYFTEDDYEICVNALMVESDLASSSGPGSAEARKKIETLPAPVFEKTESTGGRSWAELVEESENIISIPPPVKNPTLPTLVKKFPEQEGHHIEVHISHVNSPSSFYIRIAGEIEKKLQKLMNEMQKKYSNLESQTEECKVGKSYAVFCPIRNKWYRGTVLSITDSGNVKVQLVDYGIEEEIPSKNLHRLLDCFTDDEEYSVCCELTAIIPAGGSSQWSYAACDAFQELVAPHETLHLSIKNEIQNDLKDKKETLPVSLFIEEIKLGGALEPTEVIYKNIASELISRGLALPIRASPMQPTFKSPEKCKDESITSCETKNSPCTLKSENPESPKISSPVKSQNLESLKVCSPVKEQNASIEEPEPCLEPTCQWKPVVYPMEPKFKGFVTNIGEDGCIQLHAVRKGSSIVEMIKKALQFKYSKPANVTVVKPPPIGTACIAKFSVDSLWYRAEIIALYPKKVKVNFVDYGNNEIVPLTDIRTDIIMQNFPKQCMDCTIFGIHTGNPGQWDNDLLNFLHSQLVESFVEVESVGPPDENGKLPCHIITSCGVSVRELLQSMGFMESDSDFVSENRSFKPATELREGDIFPVCITQINSPNIVYLQRLKIAEPKSDYEKEYNKEHDSFLDLIKELQEKAESFPKVTEPLPGMAFCAKYSYDNNWYRCEVTDLEETGAVVLYVDYGNSETTSFENLRIPDNHIIDFPVQVYFCEIHGMSPVGSEWDPAVKAFLIKKLLESGLEIYAKVVVPGKISQVDLMVKNEEGEMKLVYEELVDMNLIKLKEKNM